MTWRFPPDQSVPEPALVSPGLRARLATGTRDEVYAALVKVAGSDRDLRRRHENVTKAAVLARRNPALLGVDIDLVRAAAAGGRSDIKALLHRAELLVHGPPKPAEPAAAPEPQARRVVKVPKGAKVRTVRQARRARHTSEP